MQSFEYASAFVSALGGSPVFDWRMLHDVDRAAQGIPFRGTISECWNSIVHYNNQGYGAFCVISELDGVGRSLANVTSARAHYVDLDNLSAMQNLANADQFNPRPSFAVQSSPGKAHVYWPVNPYRDNARFDTLQRKLRQFFDGDKAVIDPTRVMRVPGTLHLKNPVSPHLVTCWALSGSGTRNDASALEIALYNVQTFDMGGGRSPLGEPSLAAPSLDWLCFALDKIDPNTLDRGEWISVTSAFKQAGWTLATEQALFYIWSEWCARYDTTGPDGKRLVNNPAENLKNWNSINNTEVGWKSFERRVPVLMAHMRFGTPSPQAQAAQPMLAMPDATVSAPVPTSEILDATEQSHWFKGCTFISEYGEILTPSGSLMNSTQFNGTYGGKKFIIDSVGKITDEAWKAATRSTLWTIQKAHHTRFVPSVGNGELIVDQLGRIGVNTYVPSQIVSSPGDISIFLRHVETLIPDVSDRVTLMNYIAHNVKYPGHKIPWAPFIQSAEGAGKGAFKRVMRYCMGGTSRVHFPNARELVESGSKFNAWMRSKLFILVDEVKVDERRDLIEVLKPMISEEEIEIQRKGHDQKVEDNFCNWMFFSNYRDAIPISKSSRRFSIFYSPLQSVDDLIARSMDDGYFNRLYDWMDNCGGLSHIADYLLNYPIERGSVPMRAPDTTSTIEALRQSRGPMDMVVLDAIDDQLPGFRNGWASLTRALKMIKDRTGKVPSEKTVTNIFEALGYNYIGRTPRPYFSEDPQNRLTVYARDKHADINRFGGDQGYE